MLMLIKYQDHLMPVKNGQNVHRRLERSGTVRYITLILHAAVPDSVFLTITISSGQVGLKNADSEKHCCHGATPSQSLKDIKRTWPGPVCVRVLTHCFLVDLL